VVIAAARDIPVVWGVFGSTSHAAMTRTPSYFQRSIDYSFAASVTVTTG
jgi:hypothetical protein